MLVQQASRQPYAEQRRAMRRETQLPAKFQCQGTFGWIDCEVTNISPIGALLKLPHEMIVGRHMRVQIPGDAFEATAEVRHQDGRVVGIAFTSSRLEAMRLYS